MPPPVTSACMPASGPSSFAIESVIRRQYVAGVTELLAGDPDRFVVTFDRAGTRTPDHPTRPEIQLLSPDFYGPRFEELTTWMRAEAPMYWDDSVGIWGAAAYDDVKRLSREWRTFCSGKGSRPESSVPSMINMDPPEHTRRRRMVGAGFSLRRVQDHEPYLRECVTKLIDSVIERGECDIVDRHRHAPADVHDRRADGAARGGPRPAPALVGPVRDRRVGDPRRGRRGGPRLRGLHPGAGRGAPRRHRRRPREPRRQRRRRGGPAQRHRPRLRDDARARRRRRDDAPRHLRRRRGARCATPTSSLGCAPTRRCCLAPSRRCCAGSARSAT